MRIFKGLLLVMVSGCMFAAAEPKCPECPVCPGQQVPADPYGGGGYGGGVTVEVIEGGDGRTYHVQQGPRGNPGDVGCADGQREAFVDARTYRNIAGCIAKWDGPKSLRTPRTGAACGDDLGACASPADACGPGWHVCGESGRVIELKQVTAEECANAGGGRFSAAISHCLTQSGCQYDHGDQARYECFPSGWCSESVCCGSDCGEFGQCRDGVWEGATHIPVGTDQGCGAVQSLRAGGILCCR